MNYTLHQIRVFRTIAKAGSISKSCELLNISQPAASIQLRKFQENFDVQLMERVGREMHITDFGQDIAKVCESIMQRVELLDQTLGAYKGILAGSLHISIVSTAKYIMPYLLEGFMKAHPNVEIAIDVTNKNKVVQSLENNECDFALVSVLPDSLVLDALPIMDNRLQLVYNPKFQDEVKSIDDLAGKTLIYRESGSATRNAMENFVKANSLTNTKKMVLVSNEAVKQSVLAGLGYSLMPEIGLRNAIDTGNIATISLPGLPMRTEWNLVYERQKQLTPAALALLEYISAEKDTIVRRHFGK